jgi:Mg-chelatase subunit ChlD
MKISNSTLALTALLLISNVVAAQGTLIVRVDGVDGGAFPQVTVQLDVREATGVPILGLVASDFDVNEDRTLWSRPITKVASFVDASQAMSIILVLDTSGTMKGQPMADVKAAAVRFIDGIGPADRVAILAFADSVSLDEPFPKLDPARESDFTSDKATLYRLVDSLTAGGNTPLYDAAFKAVRLTGRQPLGNRAVLLFTDGRDEVAGGPRGSGSTVANEDSPLREANRTGIPIFTVGLGDEIDVAYLKRLPLETGGTYQQTPASGQLVQLFQNVADQLKQRYSLTFTSGMPRDGQKHQFAVMVKTGARSASGEFLWGPVPLAPTPTTVAAAASSSPPATQPAATVSAVATAISIPPPATLPAATTTPVATATSIPLPATPPAPSAAIPVQSATDDRGLMVLLGVGLAALMILALAMLGRRCRGPERSVAHCQRCGHALPAPGAACPSCSFGAGST